MGKEILRTLGLIIFLAGVFIFLSSSSGLTGLAILEDESERVGSIFSIVFIITGIALFLFGRKNEAIKLTGEDIGMKPPKEFYEWIKAESDKEKIGWKRVLGIVLILVGVVLLLSSFSGLTGYAVFEGGVKKTGSILGIVLVVAGLFVIMMARKKTSGLVDIADSGVKIIRTSGFDRSIRGADLERVNNVIKKIGTGLGGEKRLVGRDDYSIRAGKGERVYFGYNEDHTKAVLTKYDPQHKET